MKLNLALLIGSPLLLCGCEHTLTYKAWHYTEANYYRPANEPHISLFQRTKPPSEILVVYRETSERTDRERTRAFFLRANESRLDQQTRPMFTDPEDMVGLEPIPILSNPVVLSSIDTDHKLYAIITTETPGFTLYSKDKAIGTYELPVYLDRSTTLKRVLLTPLAVTGDVGTACAIVGYVALVGFVESGGSFYIR